ncbi:hypothetical protein HHK36_003618 [Tetracentron sinense]|uniref:Uncharacterized protein n=1 Tax=Tetracentron sinense TaxID=13715 RepID=A0A835DSC1_TETSI|nr:hypothetical protein HHK36_003618 [Tetracentron sinense]
MARLATVLLIFMVLFVIFLPSFEARKIPSLEGSLILSALPKGTTPPSAPSKKGHAMVVNQRLFTQHLRHIDRILQSVPSPGAGH